MLFEVDPSSTACNSWKRGEGVRTRIHVFHDILMWNGGSLGWNSPVQRLEDEGKTPLPIKAYRKDRLPVVSRLAACWNALLGLEVGVPGTEGVQSVLLRGLRILERTGRGTVGALEAGVLLRRLRATEASEPRRPLVEAADALSHTDARGAGFCWGLRYQGGAWLTDQTFSQADATRLAACWNAANGIADTTLMAAAVDLMIRASFCIAATEKLSAPGFCRSDEQTILLLGGRMAAQRMRSGAFHTASSACLTGEAIDVYLEAAASERPVMLADPVGHAALAALVPAGYWQDP